MAGRAGKMPNRAGGQGYAVSRVSFGRRLALFFLLIAIVPTAALIAILLFVSDDSQRGKADARLAAGLQTAVAIYNQHTGQATIRARQLARDPALAAAVRSGRHGQMQAVVDRAAAEPGVVRIALLDNAGRPLAVSGSADAIAPGRVGLTDMARPVGTLTLSTTTAQEYVGQVHQLTGRQLVLRRGQEVRQASRTSA